MFYVAHVDHLFEQELPLEVVPLVDLAAMMPGRVFFLSIPIAFFDTGLALLSWILDLPARDARRPQAQARRGRRLL